MKRGFALSMPTRLHNRHANNTSTNNHAQPPANDSAQSFQSATEIARNMPRNWWQLDTRPFTLPAAVSGHRPAPLAGLAGGGGGRRPHHLVLPPPPRPPPGQPPRCTRGTWVGKRTEDQIKILDTSTKNTLCHAYRMVFPISKLLMASRSYVFYFKDRGSRSTLRFLH